MKQAPGRGRSGTLLASMENALVMEVTTDGADDRAGHGESHNSTSEMDRRDMARVKRKWYVTTYVVNLILKALFVSFVLSSFFVSWTSTREGLCCLVLFP